MKIILAEKMMGHSIKSIPMADIYNLPTVEVLFKEYRKAIPELIIDNTARKQAELDAANREMNLLKKVNNDNELRLRKLEEWATEQSEKN